MYTHQLDSGDGFNELASWWRIGVCQDDCPPGATWFVSTRWPRMGDSGPAVVDDYGNLVIVGWLQ